MTRKNFKTQAEKSTNIYEILETGKNVKHVPYVQNVSDVQDTQDVKNVHYVQDVHEQLERLNLKMPGKYKSYLKQAAYRESTPENAVSLTEYLCRLIDKDMQEHNK